MNYDEALRRWGARKIGEANRRYNQSLVARLTTRLEIIPPDEVAVEFDFSEGYACCGGTDPECYCSFFESPRANVLIRAGLYRREIPVDEFDFATVLKEIVEAGGGTVTA